MCGEHHVLTWWCWNSPVVPPAVCADLQRYVDRDADDFRTEIADYDDRTIQAAGHVSIM